MTEQTESNNHLPLEELQAMELPQVPKNIANYLAFSWKGRCGIPASSAVSALTDKYGNPLIVMTMYYKQCIIEEEHPFKDAKRESKNFIEIVRELHGK